MILPELRSLGARSSSLWQSAVWEIEQGTSMPDHALLGIVHALMLALVVSAELVTVPLQTWALLGA
jgi:hypothetical protein